MKLLVVSNMYPSKAAPSYGVFVKNFCDQLEALGIEYSLAVMPKGTNKLGKLTGYVRFYLKSFFSALFGKYDAVYVHYASHSSPGVLLARKLQKFTVITNCHGSDVIPQDSRQEKMQKNTRAILSLSEKIIVPSPFFKRVVTEKYSIAPEKVFVCASGGVDTNRFFPAPKQTAPFTVGFVSRLIPGKGWDVFLKACAMLPDRDIRILMVGGGPEMPRLLALAQKLGLQDRLETLGGQPQDQLPGYCNQMDVFVFPTMLQESLGLVAVEAMACGVPVIASDFAAPADYIADGENGYKFPVGDAQKLADAITAFRALPPDARKALSERALQTAQEYTREKVTEALGKILLE
ncbi:MAG: glycosyltransferase family 4 protein [Oscillospiraceae bacterium]|nr:glycosyltransferase family 4 protein [Oscillospiraceae bacterium]